MNLIGLSQTGIFCVQMRQTFDIDKLMTKCDTFLETSDQMQIDSTKIFDLVYVNPISWGGALCAPTVTYIAFL